VRTKNRRELADAFIKDFRRSVDDPKDELQRELYQIYLLFRILRALEGDNEEPTLTH